MSHYLDILLLGKSLAFDLLTVHRLFTQLAFSQPGVQKDRALLTIGWLLVIAATGTSFFRLQLDSDLLFQHDLITNLFTQHWQWRDWRFTPAPAYLPDTLLNALLYFVFELPADRLLAVSILQALLVTGAALLLARRLHPALSVTARFAILLVSAALSLLASQNEAWIYEIHNNVHIPGLLFSLLGLALVLEHRKRPRLSLLLMLIISLATGIFSGALMYLIFVMPLFLLEVRSSLSRQKFVAHPARQRLVSLALGTLLGASLTKLFTFNHPLAERTLVNLERLKFSGRVLWQTLGETLCTPDSLILTGLIAVSAIWVQKRYRSALIEVNSANPQTNIQWLWHFTLLSAGLTLLGSLLSGGFVDRYGLRYFALVIVLTLILAVVLADRLDAQADSPSQPTANEHARYLPFAACGLMTLMVIACIWLGLHKLPGSIQEFRRFGPQHYQEKAIAACLDELHEQGVPLSIGMSDYWHARGVQHQSRFISEIVAFTNDLSYFYWMSSKRWLTILDPQHYINFVLVARVPTEPIMFDFTAAQVIPRLPTGFTRHACSNVAFDVLYYADRRLDTFARTRPIVPHL